MRGPRLKFGSTSRNLKKLNASTLSGKEVIGLNGWKIGKVKECVFDTGTWQITHLDVGLKGDIAEELGLKQTFKTTHVLIDVRRVQGVGDAVILNTSKEDLLAKLTASDAAPNSEVTQQIPSHGTESSRAQ